MSTLFFRNPRLLIVTILLIVVAGLSAAVVLPRMEDPRFANRGGAVITRFPGASAERVESLVSRPLEDELETIEAIRLVTSTSRAGVSVLRIELSDTVGFGEVDEVWSRVRDKLADVEPLLPANASRPEFDNDRTFAFTLIAAIVWESDAPVSAAVLNRLAEQLEDDLLAVPGTEYTNLFGVAREEIRVSVDPNRLAALDLTAAELAEAISRSDAKVAAGQFRAERSDLLIEVAGEIETLDRLADVSIRTGADGQFVRLGDVATIEKTIEDPPSRQAVIDGRVGVAVAARMGESAQVDRWAADARARVEALGGQLAPGVDVRIIFDQSTYTEARLAELVRNFVLAVFAVIAVIVILMGWRSALLVGTSLPLAALMVLTWMNWMGVPIHQMSVTGLIIALGLLIDNAIVMVDEIGRRRGDATALVAVRGAVRHLAVPLLGSTLTTVLAFMPIVLMPGGAGEFVGTIALGVILALISSLFLSLTVIPALAGRFVRAAATERRRTWWRDGARVPALTRVHERSLAFALRYPVLGMAFALALPALGFLGGSQLVEQFFPPADRDQFQLQLRLPDQASIAATRAAVERARVVLDAHESVTTTHWFLGDSAPLFYYNMTAGEDDSPNFAQALIQLDSAEGGTDVIRAVQSALEHALPNTQVIALQLEQGPPFAAPIELKILGPDLDVLRERGETARRILASVPDVIASRATFNDGRPTLLVELDEQETRRAGLDNLAVAAQLEASLEGAIGGSLLEVTEELPIRVRLSDGHRREEADIASIDLLASRGAGVNTVPLAALGDTKLVPQVASIDRQNGVRTNRVFGYVTAGVLPGVVLGDYRRRLETDGFTLPAGYTMAWGGEAGERDRAIGNLTASIAVLAVLMGTVLVLSFGSFRLAGLIAVVAASSAGLGLGALWLFDFPFGFMAIVGIMGLMGVAINDSIVVLAALRDDPAARAGDRVAMGRVVMHASRHVVATTLTTIAGFLPLLLSGGGFWPPLATAIAGGVIGATLLALYFVPSAYVMLVGKKATRGVRVQPFAEIPALA